MRRLVRRNLQCLHFLGPLSDFRRRGADLGRDGSDQLRGEVRRQALNDVGELQDFLLTQGVEFVVQQFSISSSDFTFIR